jgi:hypothetical protein
LIDTHRAGDFRLSRFAPASDESSTPQKNAPAVAHGSRETPLTAFRVFRPEIQANVELQQNYPTRIYFRGMRGNIIAASGPWRTSGDWWREDTWQQDEWDVEVRFDSVSGQSQKISSPRTQNGIYRIYYDSLRAAWFVRGRYD